MKQFFINELRATFNLREPRSEKPSEIYLLVRIQGRQYKLSTGAKVYPCQWDRRRHMAKVGQSLSKLDVRNNTLANARIARITKYFEEFKQYLRNNPAQLAGCAELLRRFVYRDNVRTASRCQRQSAVGVLERLLFDSDIKDSSMLQNDRNLQKFRRFLEDNRISDSFASFNLQTITMYQSYLKEQGSTPTTIRNIIKGTLFPLLRKAARNTAVDYDWNASGLDAFELAKDRSNKQMSANKRIALTEEQVEMLYRRILTKEDFEPFFRKPVSDDQLERLRQIKDLFVFQCYVGQRVSDLHKFFNGEADYDADTQTVTIIQQKTNSTAIIPLFPISKELLEKYRGRDISFYSRQSTNTFLKYICRIAGFDETVRYQVNGTTMAEPFYSLVHTHTARHTLTTILMRRGFNKEQIITITGHKDFTMIDEIYSHLTLKDNAKKVVAELKRTGMYSDLTAEEGK